MKGAELAANALNAASIVLAGRNSAHTWWTGIAACALFAWVFLHELTHREAARGPRIVKFLNREIGRWRNHAALWVTSIALPGARCIGPGCGVSGGRRI